jgi:ABC-type nitrate/sulfonate/bicarbonate transport system substrate-binding protein
MLRRTLLTGMAALAAAFSVAPLSINSARANDIVKVHVPNPGIETMPFLIADDLGFYSKQGIQLDRRTMKVDIGVMAAVGGQVDVTQILGLSLRGAIERGADLRIAMVFNKLATYSLFVRKPLGSYAELKGHKVGSTSSGASATKVLRITLQDNKLDADKDVNIFYIGDAPTIFQALVSGNVSAAVLTAPFDVAAAARPELQELPFANKPGVLMAGVSANTKFLYGRPEVAKRFLRGTWEGLGYLISNRSESVKLMVKHMKIDEDTASKVYDRWINRFEPDGALSPEFIDQVLAFEFGKVNPGMADKAFDFSVMKSFSKTN